MTIGHSAIVSRPPPPSSYIRLHKAKAVPSPVFLFPSLFWFISLYMFNSFDFAGLSFFFSKKLALVIYSIDLNIPSRYTVFNSFFFQTFDWFSVGKETHFYNAGQGV